MPKRLKKKIPKTRLGRLIVGTTLCICGVFGFLPVIGYWMFPLGLFVLSVDFPSVRRFRRKWGVRLGRKWTAFRQKNTDSYEKRGLYKNRDK